MLPPTRRYTLQDLKDNFHERELKASAAEIGSIVKVEMSDDSLWSEIRNTGSRNIELEIFFDEMEIDGETFLDIESQCSCAKTFACKHAAAVLLYMLERRAAPVAKPAAPTTLSNPALLQWIYNLRRASQVAAKKPKARSKATQSIHYLIHFSSWHRQFILQTIKGRIDPGAPEKRNTGDWNNAERALLAPPQFTDAGDLDVFRLMLKICGKGHLGESAVLSDKNGALLVDAALATGRAYFCPTGSSPHKGPLRLLSASPERPGEITWQTDTHRQIVPHLVTRPPSAILILTEPPYYIDPDSGAVGPVQTKTAPALLDVLFQLPPLTPADLPLIANVLAELAPDIPLPDADAAGRLREIDMPLQPVITLHSLRSWAIYKHRKYAATFNNGYYDYAEVRFAYGEASMTAHDPQDYVTVGGGETVRVLRKPVDEKAQLALLATLGFAPVVASAVSVTGGFAPTAYGLESETAWTDFSSRIAPQLRAAGWRVVIPADFRHHVLSVESWDAELSEGEAGWFGLDMGIVVDGERLPLAPLLHSLFRSDGRWLDAARIANIADDEQIELHSPQGARIRIAAERIKPLARTLIDLFDGPTGTPTLRLPRADA
ncbi:MAG: SWIM zinc finger family protein, partial [Rhodocyclaceae bacterium]